jgi:ferrous iron transport protein B
MNERKPIALPAGCTTCPAHHAANLRKWGVDMGGWDFVVALAGNPNVGKSTVFNALTGLRQHTGNWPGKTVTRAEGGFVYDDRRYKLVDLPGTYSLLATSLDEEVARDFILFGRPSVTIVVVDASRLERNLNLVLQVLDITDRVVVCLNLVDEARRHGVAIDERHLARRLGVPVIPTVARYREGFEALLQAVSDVATGRTVCKPYRKRREPSAVTAAADALEGQLHALFPNLPNARWVALRLLDGDERIIQALRQGDLGDLSHTAPDLTRTNLDPSPEANGRGGGRRTLAPDSTPQAIIDQSARLRLQVGDFHQGLVEATYADAAGIADSVVTRGDRAARPSLDQIIDRLVTSRMWGFPLMALLFALVFWITIVGANYPSAMLMELLIGRLYPALHVMADAVHLPSWLSGLLIDGMYLATAWVISVMLPPMAIFFPLFTLLEDFGYLPRVAFNLDNIFKRAGAHGKQALSMMMGFGCNAAGIVATRVIDSPRERLIAMITNNFALCNGRWPTQILLATLFISALVPPFLAGIVSALAVVGVAMLGVLLTFGVAWGLSRTLLQGEVSTFSLELPPYRPPRIWHTLYTSFIDRTLFVLWRAIVFALPAGAVIWLIANVNLGGVSIAHHLIYGLDPFGLLIGLNGIILVAYIVAIPANEIVIPTVLMLTVLMTGISDIGTGAGVMFELDSDAATMSILQAGGWTLLTAVNVMLFSLVHNPCSTTLYTIYKESGSRKWTVIAVLLPLTVGFVITFVVAQFWHLIGTA